MNDLVKISSKESMRKLIIGNRRYVKNCHNPANISEKVRVESLIDGEKPYAVILTCSDSRVPVEHIFSAGIGDIFVIRTLGNVIGNFEIGSIEYATSCLGAGLLLIMGHSKCGAIEIALKNEGEGYIRDIIEEIQLGIDGENDEYTAIYNNILHSKDKILQSEIIKELIKNNQLIIACAKYEMETGKVKFLSEY